MKSIWGIQAASRTTAPWRFGQLWPARQQHSVLYPSVPTRPAYPVGTGSWHPVVSATRASGIAGLMSNYALERSVKRRSERAAGARTIIAPAARWQRLARPAQRGR